MKRVSALLLGLYVAAGLAGCSGNVMPNTNTTAPTSPTGAASRPDITTPPAGKDSPPKHN